ncbi:glycosyltransferase family 2 protein [Rhodobacter calidifons]|uniref:Glycosyltransferase family 2 protein n=1 Tax=Rhodobacter calidifons TaxID=2715277 RepID=A0ABX0G6U4_9RHOB|nr:glycosyltransferase family 2 protein [Rhodobacter calidifons]NHB77003.1 glycosyltransferase family 2 protein [Rhodobacter calidifons]
MTDPSIAPRIALCAIIRNEIRALVEWLAHYKALGVSEVVIYDNSSTDGTTEALRVLDEAGELVHLDWPHSVGARPQRLAYEHARRHSDADWLAFFDADEFLVLHQDASLGAFLARMPPDVSAVAENWIVFGSGGAQTYLPLPVTERFTEALAADAPANRTVKAIGRRERLSGTGIHRVAVAQGRYVMPSGAPAEFDGLTATVAPEVTVAALHHYAIKSQEEFAEKRARGHANSQFPEIKRARLEAGLATLDAGGARNDILARRSGPMRAEALRLRGNLLEAGLRFPVWPFVEHS